MVPARGRRKPARSTVSRPVASGGPVSL